MSIDYENMTYETLSNCKRSEKLDYASYWQAMFEAGIPLERLSKNGLDQWVEAALEVRYNTIYRKIPQPITKIISLDFDDQLVGVVAVKIEGKSRHLITDQSGDGVTFNENWADYFYLREHYTRLDGSRFEKEVAV